MRRLDIGARASGISIEDPVVSFLDTDISLERLLDKLYKVCVCQYKNGENDSLNFHSLIEIQEFMFCSKNK